jgi:hypothetical protein
MEKELGIGAIESDKSASVSASDSSIQKCPVYSIGSGISDDEWVDNSS